MDSLASAEVKSGASIDVLMLSSPPLVIIGSGILFLISILILFLDLSTSLDKTKDNSNRSYQR